MEVLQLRRYSPGYFDLLAHPSYDRFWETFDVAARHPKFEVPAYHLTGWYDSLLNGTLANFAGLRANAGNERARRNQRLIVGPWTHARPNASTTKIGDVDFGADAGFDSEALIVRWFRHWMPSRPPAEVTAPDWDGAPVRIFLMGENRWRDEQEWPLARAVATPFYLHSGARRERASPATVGSARPRRPGRQPTTTSTYDPAKPVPTGVGAYSRTPVDRRAVQAARRRAGLHLRAP